MGKLVTNANARRRSPRLLSVLREKIRDVYPSQDDWDQLLQSIDEKAANADALVNDVLESQARRRA